VELLDEFLLNTPESSRIVILVDALDEVFEDREANAFLMHMKKLIAKHPHVYFLCSSREHIRVKFYLGSDLLHPDVKPTTSQSDMDATSARR
jgi:hypothetical protein